MSPLLKKLSPSRNARKTRKNRLNNRRTSLNVNLSYVSDPSISPNRRSHEETVDDINSTTTTTTPRKNTSVPNDGRTRVAEISGEFLSKIKPSYVRLTSTPLPSKYATLLAAVKSSDKDRLPSRRQRRFSEVSTIVLETSTDTTDVRGAFADSAVADNDSMNFVPDTERPEFVENPPPATIVPDSQPDVSADTVRTSMNVNTSLDSVVDRNFGKNQRIRNDIDRTSTADGRGWNESISGSSIGSEIPTNSIVVTRAVIEHENSYSQRTIDDGTVVEVAKGKRIDAPKKTTFAYGEKSSGEENSAEKNEANETSREGRLKPLGRTPVLDKEIRNSRLNYSSESNGNSKNASSSSPSSSLPLSARRKNLGDIYQRIINGGLNKSWDPQVGAPSKKRKVKRKLMRLRGSEIIDLSPVSVRLIRPANCLIVRKKMNGRNETGKRKLCKTNKGWDVSKSTNEAEEEEAAPPPSRKKEKRARRVKAKKIVINKLRDVELRKLVNDDANAGRKDRSDEEDSSEAEFPGTSLDDFEPKNHLTQRKSGRNRRKIMIVATGLPVEEKKLIKGIAAELGSAKLQRTVSRHTTHVVSKGTRTANLLRGIIRGCWVVSFEWISRSREAGKWLDAEAYEMRWISKAVEKNRRERQLFKAAYMSELFLTCGSIHISGGTSTPVSVLKELVRLAGGRVAPDAKRAKIIIGSGGLKEVWMLDSITHGELQPFERYSKKKSSS